MKSEALKLKLELLKETVQNFDFAPFQNVVFLNLYALYTFMAKLPVENTTISAILDEIESYIPLGLSENTVDLFLYAAQKPEEADKYNRLFSGQARMEFLNLIREARAPWQWEQVLGLCENLRKQLY